MKRRDGNGSTADTQPCAKRIRKYSGLRPARTREPESTIAASPSVPVGSSTSNAPPSVKSGRNRTGFRAARSREPESMASAGPGQSTSSNSRVTTLAVGPTGRRKGKHKDRNHKHAGVDPSLAPARIEDSSYLNNDQSPYEPEIEPYNEPLAAPVASAKRKRKRNNNAQVHGEWSLLQINTDSLLSTVETLRVALNSRFNSR